MSAAQILVWVVIVFAASVAVGMLYEAQTKEKGSGAPVWFGCLVVGYVILFVVASRG
jgi:L-asparagine transporter-like permease